MFLLAQAALLYSSIRPEAVPAGRPLAEFPHTSGPGSMAPEGVVDQETLDILKADDLLNRIYMDPSGPRRADLVRRGVPLAAQRESSAFAEELPSRERLDAALTRDEYPVDVGAARADPGEPIRGRAWR